MMPVHGEQRNERQETTYGPSHTFVDAETGKPIYEGPTSSSTRPVSERYCGTCLKWQPQSGIFATIMGCPDCGRDWNA